MRADYVRVLQQNFSAREIEMIVARVRALWPDINQKLYDMPSARQIMRRAKEQGIRLRMSRYGGYVGLGLRGFYFDAREIGAKRALIFINTAHHPGIVALTWLHEMGHHLTRPFFRRHRTEAQFLIDAGYDLHLTSRPELAADIIAVLGVYPRTEMSRLAVAEGRYEQIARAGIVDNDLINQVFIYARERMGISPLKGAERKEMRERYSPEAVHFIKMRCALLSVYGI
jgi:hypothetical protein